MSWVVPKNEFQMDTSLLSQPDIFGHPGFIGGMIGGLIGLLGGICGAIFSYRKARSQREKQWIVLYSIAIILLCVGGVWALLTVQANRRVYFQIGVQVILGPLILACAFHLNRLHRQGEK